MGVAHLPVAVFWKEISTIPIGQSSGQMKRSVLIGKVNLFAQIPHAAFNIRIAIGRRRGLVQPNNYMGGAESDIRVNIKGGVTHMND